MVKWTCGSPNVHPADVQTGPTSLLWLPTDFDSFFFLKKKNKYSVSEDGERVKSQETGPVIWRVAKQNPGINNPAGETAV